MGTVNHLLLGASFSLATVVNKFHIAEEPIKFYSFFLALSLPALKYGWLFHKDSIVFLNFDQNYSRIAYILADDLLCLEETTLLISPLVLFL